ncbi:MAG: NUDIX domain-containing protein [Anaerolineae bacterium]|nr:NUDIX domain-containing protein [Anaerolineae bacterium]MDW8172911.1 NUDIX hydrolase [Anaerolineae bacterium]
MSREANFCPRCGAPLTWQQASGRLRPVCPQCSLVVYFDPKVAVLAFIVHEERLLLVRRALPPHQGQWAMPAGFMDYDEDPQQAVVREVLEETGLHVQVERLLEIFPRRDDGQADLVIAYACAWLDGRPQAADDADALGWFARADLPPLAFYPSQQLAARWQKGLLG